MKNSFVVMFLVGTGFVLCACASTSPAAEKVALYRYAPTVEWFTARDRVLEMCRLVKTEDFGQNGGPITRSHAREYAAVLHTDTVLWWEYSEDPERVEGDLALVRGAGVHGVFGSSGHGGISHAAFFVCSCPGRLAPCPGM